MEAAPRPRRRTAAGRCALASAILLTLALQLTGCAPGGVAVGDTQGTEPSVPYEGADAQDATIAVVGRTDTSGARTADHAVVDALDRAGFDVVYASTRDADEGSRHRAFEDAVHRGVTVIMLSLDDGAAGSWGTTLRRARDAGIPVVLLGVTTPMPDATLYAAAFDLRHASSDKSGESAHNSERVGDAMMRIIRDRPHGKTIPVIL